MVTILALKLKNKAEYEILEKCESQQEKVILRNFVFSKDRKTSFYSKRFRPKRKLWSGRIQSIIDLVVTIIDYDLAKIESFAGSKS